MKKETFKVMKKLNRSQLLNLHAGGRDDLGLKPQNGNTTTCGDEPQDKFSVEYSMWLNCVKSLSPTGGTEFCPFGS